MRAWNRRIKKAAAEWFAIPEDALLTVSRVTCVAGRDLIVENVASLVQVSETEVVVDLGDSLLHVVGDGLEVTLVAAGELHVRGPVHEIRYDRSRGAQG